MRITVAEHIPAEMKKWFFEYIQTFDSNDPEVLRNINLKKLHTMRVCEEILHIGRQLDLNNDELRLAEIIALMHDVGRFKQYARYKTFVDKKSENHAELGVRVLGEAGILNLLNNQEKNIVEGAVRYHNRAHVPPDESEQCLFYSKLVRDADKLDIWKIVIDYYNRENRQKNKAIELDLPDIPGFSDEVYQDLVNKRIVDIKHIRNFNDFKLLQVGWIFDINFHPSFAVIKERRYLESIRKALPESEKIDEIYNVIFSLQEFQLKQKTV